MHRLVETYYLISHGHLRRAANEKPDTNESSCEYCDAHVDARYFGQHTEQCALRYKQERDEARKYESQESIIIPCEYCEAPVKAENWEWHVEKCAEAEKKRLEKMSEEVSLKVSNERIPCKYCGHHYRAQVFEEHQKKCRREKLEAAILKRRAEVQIMENLVTIPEHWDQSSTQNLARYVLDPVSDEYQAIATNFHKTLPTSKINQIERIQNRRWFRQYEAHKDHFIERYSKSTEQWLFHGCRRSEAADAIIKDCFNRSHAVNCAAGQGIYFAVQSYTSHRYTSPDANGLRYMFMARVLVGKTTAGNPSTRVCPPGFDTTGARGVYVTYHDAQAYGQYLITYT
ncbi:unnamed protein product [Adineta ricciae]|uniref:Poly [ADP-ribose] polymerase n=1 Tax=Adineta ricciae TaxID=249248 RepID=A0A816EWR6_ADIRI|nr:unnamed protein product [Adineta ricciae]